jgi:trans-aconitate methyltransferase
VDGYRIWSATYDQPGNGIFAYEEPLVHEIIDPLAPGAAVDAAACDTGRHAEYLTARGHQVIGADSSPEMLTRARAYPRRTPATATCTTYRCLTTTSTSPSAP